MAALPLFDVHPKVKEILEFRKAKNYEFTSTKHEVSIVEFDNMKPSLLKEFTTEFDVKFHPTQNIVILNIPQQH